MYKPSRPVAGLLVLIAWVLALIPVPTGRAQESSPLTLALTAEGAITAPMAGYLNRGIRLAQQQGAGLIVFQLDTPGGSVQIMSDMIQAIRSSPVPIVVYVAPRGAMAASAGTLITLAGHAAAMAPETTIGAASPVGPSGENLDSTSDAKLKNDMKATVRTLAERRPPEAVRLAEQAIDTAAAASATEALQVGLVDFIAADLNDLLRQLDGFTVQVNGQSVTLQTAFTRIETIQPTIFEQALGVVTNPNIVLLLLNLGIVAILIELSSPGGWVAGFIGVVSLGLATYGLGILPVNWFGILFLVIAFVLFILDIKAPTHGALTAAGVGSLIAGSLVLFNSPSVPRFQRVSVPLAVISSSITGVLFLLILLFALRAQKIPVRTGQERLVGQVGVARTDLSPGGIIQLGGEQWTAQLAEGEAALPRGSRVQVVGMDGLRVVVKKAAG